MILQTDLSCQVSDFQPNHRLGRWWEKISLAALCKTIPLEGTYSTYVSSNNIRHIWWLQPSKADSVPFSRYSALSLHLYSCRKLLLCTLYVRKRKRGRSRLWILDSRVSIYFGIATTSAIQCWYLFWDFNREHLVWGDKRFIFANC